MVVVETEDGVGVTSATGCTNAPGVVEEVFRSAVGDAADSMSVIAVTFRGESTMTFSWRVLQN